MSDVIDFQKRLEPCPRCHKAPIIWLRRFKRRLRCCIGMVEAVDVGIAIQAWNALREKDIKEPVEPPSPQDSQR